MKTLKNVLFINALSSGATGVGLIVFASWIAELFGVITPTPVMGVGFFLVGFAILVFRESRRTILHVKMIRLIVLLDSAWVVTSLIVIVLQLFDLSSVGYFAIGAVAVWVGAMAYLQSSGVRQLTAAKP